MRYIIFYLFLSILCFGCKKKEASTTPSYTGSWSNINSVNTYTMCLDGLNNLYIPYNSGFEKWDGNTWSIISGINSLNGGFNSMCSDSLGNIYAGGTIYDSDSIIYVAEWNGSTWNKLHFGNTKADKTLKVYSICTDPSNNLYAAIGMQSYLYFYVVKWNGNSWDELGTGVNALNANNLITSICSDKSGNIYAAGEFSDNIGSYVAKWNGTTWIDLGDHNLYGGYEIDALCNDAFGNIYISTAGGSGQSIVLKWNGTNWSKLFDASVTYAIC